MGKIVIKQVGDIREIEINEVTHVGRRTDLIEDPKLVARKFFFDARKFFVLPDCSVSRNHALIYPPTSNRAGSVVDLDSTNGTFIDGRALLRGMDEFFTVGDRIRFGGAEFLCSTQTGSNYEDLHKAPITFNQDYPNYGLMVASRGGNLWGVENDVRRLREEFEKRGFKGNLEMLVDVKNSKDILARLDEISKFAGDDSIVLFYYSGHGREDGSLVLDGGFYSSCSLSLLHPKDLLDALSKCRGQKLVILDGCYTAKISSFTLPLRVVIIGSETRAYEGACLSVCANEPGGQIMGYFSRALQKALQASSNQVNVQELVNKILSEDSRIRLMGQRMDVESYTDIVLPSSNP